MKMNVPMRCQASKMTKNKHSKTKTVKVPQHNPMDHKRPGEKALSTVAHFSNKGTVS